MLLMLVFSLNGEEKPNILWIIVEDMSQDLGCYGNKAVRTPVLDGLAKKGMRFDNTFVTGPACSPSRTAMATGVYQTSLGAYHMRYSAKLKPMLPKGIRVLPQMMRDLGYNTGNIRNIAGGGTGKDDWLFEFDGKGWDTNDWKKLTAKKPFYAQINLKESHRAFSSTIPKEREKLIKIPPYYPTHPVSIADWSGYLASIEKADKIIGRILEKLKEDELEKNTIIFFISDHGRPMTRGKNWLYDSGLQIPFILYVPDSVKKPSGYKTGGVNDQLISTIDLVAQTVKLGGGEVPKWMQGKAFMQNDSKPREFIYGAIDRVGGVDSCSRSIRTKRFKYIRNFKKPGSINECSTAYRKVNEASRLDLLLGTQPL